MGSSGFGAGRRGGSGPLLPVAAIPPAAGPPPLGGPGSLHLQLEFLTEFSSCGGSNNESPRSC